MSLVTNLQDVFTAIATQLKATRTLLNGNAADLSGLTTNVKTDLVSALNEVKASVGQAGAVINDSATVTTQVWSSSKTNSAIATAATNVKNELLGGAGTAYDTLKELQDALEADDSDIAGLTTALSNRVRFDASQTLTAPQQLQARTNIGAGTSSLVIGTGAGTAADAATTITALAGKAASSHTHTVSQIADSTTVGQALVKAADAAAARAAIGAGTSSLVIGTTTGTAADAATTITSLAGKAATSHTHVAADISNSTTIGRALIVAADAAAGRTAIGAGTSNLALGTTSSTAKAGDYQPTAANISDASTLGRALLTAASAAAARTSLDAASATDVGNTAVNFVTVFETALA